jgi:hypothetical protein
LLECAVLEFIDYRGNNDESQKYFDQGSKISGKIPQLRIVKNSLPNKIHFKSAQLELLRTQ